MSHIEVGNTIVSDEPSAFNVMDVPLYAMIIFAIVQIFRNLKQ